MRNMTRRAEPARPGPIWHSPRRRRRVPRAGSPMSCLDHARPRLPGSSRDPTAPADDPSLDRGAMLTQSGPTPVDYGPGDGWEDAARQLPDRLGHYRLIAPRARGGQAEVWEADGRKSWS